MESSIAVFLSRQPACERLPTPQPQPGVRETRLRQCHSGRVMPFCAPLGGLADGASACVSTGQQSVNSAAVA